MNADSSKAIQTFGLTKKFNSYSKTLQSARRIQNISQFFSFFKVLLAPKEKNLLALDGVSLEVEQGDIYGLLGPNGAGKTTLIKILSTLILPDQGKAYVFGTDIVKHPREALKKIQTSLADETGFEWRLTGRQNLELFAELYGIPSYDAKRKIDELLAMTGIERYADISYNKYSTGTAKKFVVCRVLLSDAPVLIFDEPTTGLDALAAIEFRKLLKDILVKEKGKTVLMASHNLWEVQQMCNKVGVLYKGRLIAQGNTAQLKNALNNRMNITLSFEATSDSQKVQLVSMLGSVQGVTDCELVESRPNGHCTLSIVGNSELDYSSLFMRIISSGVKIRSLESSGSSLEDVFIQLTKEGN